MSDIDCINSLNQTLLNTDSFQLRARYKDLLARSHKVNKMAHTETRKRQVRGLNQEYKSLIDWAEAEKNKGAE